VLDLNGQCCCQHWPFSLQVPQSSRVLTPSMALAEMVTRVHGSTVAGWARNLLLLQFFTSAVA
jgi:hypothetical protein